MTGLLAASVLLLLVIIMGSGLLYSGYRRNEMTALANEIDRRIQSEYVSGADLPSYMEYNNALLKALNYKVAAIEFSTGFNRYDPTVLCYFPTFMEI